MAEANRSGTKMATDTGAIHLLSLAMSIIVTGLIFLGYLEI
jgi:hypothetical protein